MAGVPWFGEGKTMARIRPAHFGSLALSTVLACSALLPLVASAQQAEQSVQGGLQEVIVTAQKRSANLQDVPFSVSATSQEQIVNSGAQNLVDLARNVA